MIGSASTHLTHTDTHLSSSHPIPNVAPPPKAFLRYDKTHITLHHRVLSVRPFDSGRSTADAPCDLVPDFERGVEVGSEFDDGVGVVAAAEGAGRGDGEGAYSSRLGSEKKLRLKQSQNLVRDLGLLELRIGL